MIDDIELARALHVLFVVHWIGGVAFVTLVGLPLAMASRNANEGWALFEAIENRFASQARWSIPLAGAAGFWMVWRLGLWGVLADGSLWWLDAMVALWTLFMAAVFIVEPRACAHRPNGRARPLGPFAKALARASRAARGGERHDRRRRRRRARRPSRMTCSRCVRLRVAVAILPSSLGRPHPPADSAG